MAQCSTTNQRAKTQVHRNGGDTGYCTAACNFGKIKDKKDNKSKGTTVLRKTEASMASRVSVC